MMIWSVIRLSVCLVAVRAGGNEALGPVVAVIPEYKSRRIRSSGFPPPCQTCIFHPVRHPFGQFPLPAFALKVAGIVVVVWSRPILSLQGYDFTNCIEEACQAAKLPKMDGPRWT